MGEEANGRLHLLSLVNLAFSAIRREKSELLAWLDNHDFARPETIAPSIVVSFRYTPFPRATTSQGRELSWRRCRGYVKMLAVVIGNPQGMG